MNVCLAGEGAFARKHADSLRSIEGVNIAALAGGVPEASAAFAAEFDIPYWTLDLGDALARGDVGAVVLATPTPLHAAQAIQCLESGKPVEIEIPIADNLDDAQRIVDAQRRTGLVAMAGHTRRYNPSHQWLHRRFRSGELCLQHLVVETFFLRRENLNAEGKPRSWTDHLLWHHACHSVDLFQYQTGEHCDKLHISQGAVHAQLGIAMDMSIGLRVPSGALCTVALSFNNDGPFGTFFRYICDKGTYIARYDDLVDGYENPIDLSDVDVCLSGIELQDRDFIGAITDGREPRASVARVLPAMETLHRLEQRLYDS